MKPARAAVVAGLVAIACGDRPQPRPPAEAAATASPGAPGLRPLTSRDGPRDGPATSATSPPAAAAAGVIEGEIALHDRVREKALPQDLLYVIARSSDTRQVVAVRREEGVRFPFSFRLSAADAMMPGVPFTGPFDLTARLSRSGDASPQAGDLEGAVKGVTAGSRGVRIVVDTVRP